MPTPAAAPTPPAAPNFRHSNGAFREIVDNFARRSLIF
jgi:hypothetical protein